MYCVSIFYNSPELTLTFPVVKTERVFGRTPFHFWVNWLNALLRFAAAADSVLGFANTRLELEHQRALARSGPAF